MRSQMISKICSKTNYLIIFRQDRKVITLLNKSDYVHTCIKYAGFLHYVFGTINLYARGLGTIHVSVVSG